VLFLLIPEGPTGAGDRLAMAETARLLLRVVADGLV